MHLVTGEKTIYLRHMHQHGCDRWKAIPSTLCATCWCALSSGSGLEMHHNIAVNCNACKSRLAKKPPDIALSARLIMLGGLKAGGPQALQLLLARASSMLFPTPMWLSSSAASCKIHPAGSAALLQFALPGRLPTEDDIK